MTTPSAATHRAPERKDTTGQMERCWHCPFRFKDNIYGADFDQDFEESNVDDWITSNPWPCHNDITGNTPCAGQALFKAGRLNVTRQELIAFWVDQDWIDVGEAPSVPDGNANHATPLIPPKEAQ